MNPATPIGHRIAWGLLGLSLLGVVLAWALSSFAGRGGGPAAEAGSTSPAWMMPDFALVDQTGRPVPANELRGAPWVADFIFTSCAGPCPEMSRRMAALCTEFADENVRFVSFTLDPLRDTPEVLAGYAKKYDAKPEQWSFLTGAEEVVYHVATKGLKLAARRTSQTQRDEGADRIIHSTRFVLIDAAGRVQGTYLGTQDEDLKRLRDDLRDLCNQGES